MKATWLDKAIGWVDPQIGLRRIRTRAAMEVALSYDAAKTGRRTDGWTTGSSSANSEVSGARVTARERSRDLIRNNPIAKNAKFQFCSKVTGTGITPQPLCPNLFCQQDRQNRGKK